MARDTVTVPTYLIITFKDKFIMKCEYDDNYTFNRNFREQGVLENIDMINSISSISICRYLQAWKLEMELPKYSNTLKRFLWEANHKKLGLPFSSDTTLNHNSDVNGKWTHRKGGGATIDPPPQFLLGFWPIQNDFSNKSRNLFILFKL